MIKNMKQTKYTQNKQNRKNGFIYRVSVLIVCTLSIAYCTETSNHDILEHNNIPQPATIIDSSHSFNNTSEI